MKEKREKIIYALFWLYLFLLLRITVFRSGWNLQGLFQEGRINLTLFQDYLPLIQEGRWLRFIYLFVGNIVWFLPLGAYLMWAGKIKKLWQIVFCGLFLSFMIELMQYIFGVGISELDDLVLNTFGTWLGAIGYRIYFLFISPKLHILRKKKEGTLDEQDRDNA